LIDAEDIVLLFGNHRIRAYTN
jgi:hypothetical protein